MSTDYDGGWKEALDRYLQPFLQLCFPPVATQIDWSKPIEFLGQASRSKTSSSCTA